MSLDTHQQAYDDGYKAGAEAANEKHKALIVHIAEIDGPIECTSLADWQRKVKLMAANFLKGT